MTDSNATLLPCPFCGGEVKMHFYRYLGPWYSVRAAHADNCPMRAPANANLRAYRTESEAIEAWNTRHERTCHLINDIEPYDTTMRVIGSCSECGHIVCGPDWYCHHCGARIEVNE